MEGWKSLPLYILYKILCWAIKAAIFVAKRKKNVYLHESLLWFEPKYHKNLLFFCFSKGFYQTHTWTIIYFLSTLIATHHLCFLACWMRIKDIICIYLLNRLYTHNIKYIYNNVFKYCLYNVILYVFGSKLWKCHVCSDGQLISPKIYQ